MKKLNYLFYLLVSLTLIFTSCKKQSLEIEYFTLEREYYLSEEDSTAGNLSFSAELELPVKYYNQEVLKSLQQQIIGKVLGEVFNSFPIDSVLVKYSNTLFEEYRKSNEPFLKQLSELKGSKAFLDNMVAIQGIAMYLDDQILSYSYERYAYMGGAHGNSSRFLYNFDLRTALPITEKDLFIENYEILLAQIIKEKIVDDNAEIESVADLNDFDFFEDQIHPNDNFFITPDGLAYVYNPYDIAPYSTGQIGVLVTYDTLKPILRPGNPIEYIYLEQED